MELDQAGHLDCARLEQVLYLAEDACLDRALLGAFRQHLDLCPTCRERARVSTRVVRLVRERSVRAAAPTELRVRILRAFAHRRTVSTEQDV